MKGKTEKAFRWPTILIVAAIIVCLGAGVIIASRILWLTYQADRMGFSGKTFWDWMDLCIVPITLAFAVFMFGLIERTNERRRTQQRIEAEEQKALENAREHALQAYLDKMTELLTEKQLRTSEKDDEVRQIARARTLTILQALDGRRKGVVLRFLYESALIMNTEPIIRLEKADLRDLTLTIDLDDPNIDEELLGGALIHEIVSIRDFTSINLSQVDLSRANLENARLNQAILSRTNMTKAEFFNAKLQQADLTLAILVNTSLVKADLTEADLNNAVMLGADLTDAILANAQLQRANLIEDKKNSIKTNLTRANLTGADLAEADLTGADLTEAILAKANLEAAKITDAQLGKVASLDGATMPNGEIYSPEQ